jgi:hypothetical protein
MSGSRLQGAHEAMLEDCWHNCVRFIRDMLAFDDGETLPFFSRILDLEFEAMQFEGVGTQLCETLPRSEFHVQNRLDY